MMPSWFVWLGSREWTHVHKKVVALLFHLFSFVLLFCVVPMVAYCYPSYFLIIDVPTYSLLFLHGSAFLFLYVDPVTRSQDNTPWF